MFIRFTVIEHTSSVDRSLHVADFPSYEDAELYLLAHEPPMSLSYFQIEKRFYHGIDPMFETGVQT